MMKPDTLSRTIELISGRMRGDPIALCADSELEAVLCPVDRVGALPFWLEEMTGSIPTDAELMNWRTVGDVARWVELVDRRAA
jgi:hypothetical protein